MRMSPDEPCRKYSLYTPTHGRKRSGHQRTNHLTYIQNLMGDSNNVLTPDVIAENAKDHGAWRNFVVACFAAKR